MERESNILRMEIDFKEIMKKGKQQEKVRNSSKMEINLKVNILKVEQSEEKNFIQMAIHKNVNIRMDRLMGGE